MLITLEYINLYSDKGWTLLKKKTREEVYVYTCNCRTMWHIFIRKNRTVRQKDSKSCLPYKLIIKLQYRNILVNEMFNFRFYKQSP